MAESNNEKKEKANSFVVRLISTIVLLLVCGSALYFGGIVLALLLCFVSVCGVFELLRVFGIHKSSMAVAAYIFTAAYDVLLFMQWKDFILPAFILYLLVLLTIYVFRYPKYEIKHMVCAFFSFFYVAVSLGYIFQLRCMQQGFLLVMLILICSSGNDICAYLVGILIGKHKMFPVLSPKKSVEGFIGGICGAALIGFGYGFVFKQFAEFGDYNYPVMFAIIGGIGALPAVVGDLAASAIKRNYGIKDYSNLIPGHGGILDRFDSMIFTAPIVYYLVTYMMSAYL